MKFTMLDQLLWASGFLSTFIVLSLLIGRRRWRHVPAFTSWMLFQVLYNISLFALYRHGDPALYTRVFWIALWPDFLLQLCVVAEMARTVLAPAGVHQARLRLIATGIACAIIFALLCWWIHPARGAFTAWELRSDLFTSLVTCELLVALNIVAGHRRLAWPREILAMAGGLTAWSCLTAVTTSLQAYLGSRDFRAVDHLRAYAWIGAMIWIAMEFGLPNRQTDPPERRPREESGGLSRQIPSGVLRPLEAHTRTSSPALPSVSDSFGVQP